ncbi:hypothetical protein ACQUSR_27965 [Streptomyces sp. P1-3]|uniref:hypothetical protein n=1 Tax=Streptomyces sp. P1-3 TaxID=3421658 RepID=UPI003D35FDFA
MLKLYVGRGGEGEGEGEGEGGGAYDDDPYSGHPGIDGYSSNLKLSRHPDPGDVLAAGGSGAPGGNFPGGIASPGRGGWFGSCVLRGVRGIILPPTFQGHLGGWGQLFTATAAGSGGTGGAAGHVPPTHPADAGMGGRGSDGAPPGGTAKSGEYGKDGCIVLTFTPSL